MTMRDPVPVRLAMALAGLTWLGLGVAKLTGPAAFASYLVEVAGLSHGSAYAVSIAVSAAEIALGAWCLLTTVRKAKSGRMIAPALMSTIVAVTIMLYLLSVGPGAPQCGCFGQVTKATYGRRLVVAASLALTGSAVLYGMLCTVRVREDLE